MRRFALILLFGLFGPALPVHAATTGWSEVHGGAVRLIATGPMEDGRYLAGLEFVLEPGWHTYWRYPGEAGVPPQITLAGSENVRDIEVLYPAPERYSDGFSESIVYHDGIVLPIRIVPEDPGRQVRFSIEVLFGVCKDICVPGDAALSLDLAPDTETDSLAERLIARDLAAVPGAAKGGALEITAVALSGSNDSLRIEARVPVDSTPDLFAAGPAGSYIGLPKLVDRTGEKAVWRLSTNGLASNDSDRTLRLVLTAGDVAVEHLETIPTDWLN